MLWSILIYSIIFAVPVALALGVFFWWQRRIESPLGAFFLYLIVMGSGMGVGIIAVLVAAIARGQFVPVFLTVLALGAAFWVAISRDGDQAVRRWEKAHSGVQPE